MSNLDEIAEAELENFRKQWREEVYARNRRPAHLRDKAPEGDAHSRSRPALQSARSGGPSTARRTDVKDYSEEVEPRTYHDLPNNEERMKLGADGEYHDRNIHMEPESALEHYERAVEKETQGNLGESLRHYRTAFKLDDGVHEAYKKKYFPPSSFVKPKPTNINPSNMPVTVPGTAHHSLHGGSGVGLSETIRQMIEEFSSVRIEAAEPPSSASPQERSPLAELPEEILSQILSELAIMDIASFARVAQVCKHLAYVVLTEDSTWKRVALGDEFGFKTMHYDYVCDIEGFPLEPGSQIALYSEAYHNDDDQPIPSFPTPEERETAFSALTDKLLHSTYSSSWRQMVRTRPRLRFNGCYISTVNYTRAGGTNTNSLTWGAPIHVVTYFRYLRFFRDGTCISLLTTSEPVDVVHHLTKANLHHHHSGYMPSSVMKDALRGRWRLSGPASSALNPVTNEPEAEGDVLIETEGVVTKYTYKMYLALAHAGRSARNNKLAWKGFWSYNKLTDDWAEFGLRNDKAFYWSRVKSYGMGWDV